MAVPDSRPAGYRTFRELRLDFLAVPETLAAECIRLQLRASGAAVGGANPGELPTHVLQIVYALFGQQSEMARRALESATRLRQLDTYAENGKLFEEWVFEVTAALVLLAVTGVDARSQCHPAVLKHLQRYELTSLQDTVAAFGGELAELHDQLGMLHTDLAALPPDELLQITDAERRELVTRMRPRLIDRAQPLEYPRARELMRMLSVYFLLTGHIVLADAFPMT